MPTPMPSAEDLLKTQTVGLVHLEDYRKRRRDAEESSGTVTPMTDGSDIDIAHVKKKKKKPARKLLSFDNDEDEAANGESNSNPAPVTQQISASYASPGVELVRKFKANPNTGTLAPKAKTKAVLAAEAQERERLRIQYNKEQELVRDTKVSIPFVFYDGSSVQGGSVTLKKGDHIWHFLEQTRRLGAEKGISGEGSVEGAGTRRADSKKSWARIGVDDLLLVRGSMIIPHQYELYYFIVNKVVDPSQPNRLLFDYASTATLPTETDEHTLTNHSDKSSSIEGSGDDPNYTKVVDRRWYDKNKHIYPASLWAEFKPGQEVEDLKTGRRDAQGNSFFFS